MDDGARLTIETVDGLKDLSREAWDSLANPPGARFDPFLSWDFLQALEESGCVSARTGWQPVHLVARDETGAVAGALPLYVKSHSMGEYVFDHSWADALQRAGGRYYPKLQAAVPFTPVPGRRILTASAQIREALAGGAVALAEQIGASSVHVTFCEASESEALERVGLMRRTGVQFHWSNAGYDTFDDFLAALSSDKRKMIRKERARAQAGHRIRAVPGRDLTEADWDHFFACYMDTGSRKWGRPYLTRGFFRLICERMADRLVMFIAEDETRPIAAALNFIGGDTLYGRYWGRLDDAPFLHFELCYYQAIAYAISHKIARVEAGAQGEHKLARGYAPVATHSVHWIAHPGLRQAVARFLAEERPAVADEIEALDAYTPFRMEPDQES